MKLFLLKLWIFNLDFTTILSFLIGIVLGGIIVCMVYAFIVLSSLRNKKFIIKTQEDNLTTQEVKDMISSSQKSFKDKDLRGDLSRIVHCKNICTSLVYGIATRYYPKSKHPLLELSIDEVLMLNIYIENRIEEIMNRRGLRLLKKLKISTIVEFTQMTNKVIDSKAFKVSKEVNSTISTIKKIVNVVNPAWWFRKLVIDKTINIITNKLCLVVIAIVGEETYKIYSKTVFDKEVNIDSNIDEILDSIDKDFINCSAEAKNESSSLNNVEVTANHDYRMKSRSYIHNDGESYSCNFSNAFPFKSKKINEENGLVKIDEEENN